MTEAEEYMQHVSAAKEHLEAAIEILARHGLDYDIELKKRMLYIDMSAKQYALKEKQVSLSGWLKGVLGWKK